MSGLLALLFKPRFSAFDACIAFPLITVMYRHHGIFAAMIAGALLAALSVMGERRLEASEPTS